MSEATEIHRLFSKTRNCLGYFLNGFGESFSLFYLNLDDGSKKKYLLPKKLFLCSEEATDVV